MLRSDESNILTVALGLPTIKKATYFERISLGSPKKDPFEGKVSGDIWKVLGNKLLKRKKEEQNG